ncbi:MAG TPA: M48 family peptidase, partial [Candidatus Binatia bacterium]|nr:M48 family peptidase [Candidatus Binatia bacterium]
MEQLVVSLFLIVFVLDFVVEFVLNELNLRYVRARRVDQDIPEFFRGKLSPGEYDKSVEYTLAKGRFQRWSEIYGRAITLVILFGGVLAFLDQFAGRLAEQFSLGVYGQGIIFCLAVAVYFTVAGLPPDLYSTFALEARFGFNKTSLGLYLTDKLKGLVLGLLIGVPFLFVILWLMQATGSLWWVWAFVFISAFQLVMIVIFPTF